MKDQADESILKPAKSCAKEEKDPAPAVISDLEYPSSIQTDTGRRLWVDFVNRLKLQDCSIEDLDVETDWKDLLRKDLGFSALEAGRLLKIIKAEHNWTTAEVPTPNWTPAVSRNTSEILERPPFESSNATNPATLSVHDIKQLSRANLSLPRQSSSSLLPDLGRWETVSPPTFVELLRGLVFIMFVCFCANAELLLDDSFRSWLLCLGCRAVLFYFLCRNGMCALQVFAECVQLRIQFSDAVQWVLQALVFAQCTLQRLRLSKKKFNCRIRPKIE
mmetsp:Transcript_17046/g.30547  ORF Transcript_17046/g.30547 Transcript_17046/m.30547 type:complete len:276 (+) Transcript_17046:130-957(+)